MQDDKNHQLELLIKIWGFLKYYHPAVARGSMDWDKEFVTEAKAILDENESTARLNEHYIRWIESLGDIQQYPSHSLAFDTVCNYNTSLEWIETDMEIQTQLRNVLKEVIVHRYAGNNRFVERQSRLLGAARFKNEAAYPEMVYPGIEYRLLTVARFWNMIEYFYPYKYLTDEPWKDVLTDIVPLVSSANDTLSYIRVLNKLVAQLRDSHSQLVPHVNLPYNLYVIPANVKIIHDSAIITEIRNDSMATIDDLRKGDVILSVNDTSIKDLIIRRTPYIGASNDAVIRRRLEQSITMGYSRFASIKFDRDGKVFTKVVSRYTAEEIGIDNMLKKGRGAWKVIADDIGYIDMGVLNRKEVIPTLKALRKTKAIIFDQRNYPNMTMHDICTYLSTKKTAFAKGIVPDHTYPGKFYCEKALSYGRKKYRHRNTGKIIILVNEITQSRAEFTTMGLQALPNSICIGSQTAGADGDRVDIVLPGNYTLIMSGVGYYYPDGRQTQRVGVHIDLPTEPTIKGIRAQKDEILERAIGYANSGQ